MLAHHLHYAYFWTMEKQIPLYFDHAATTPLDPEVQAVMADCMRDVYGNPSSLHAMGREARVVVESSRRTIARALNVSPDSVFFTSGGTEANNSILWGCFHDLKRSVFITAATEHPAVLATLEDIKQKEGIQLHFVRLNNLGLVDMDHLEALLESHPEAVVSLMHANNETGNLIQARGVSSLCRQYGALFHSDTVQTIGKFRMDMEMLDMDFAVGSAHKFYGPKGVGFMVMRSHEKFSAFVKGGGQERKMRGGTENVYGIAGMAKALQMCQETMDADLQQVEGLRETFIRLIEKVLPGVEFNGSHQKQCLPHILNITLPGGVDKEMLLPRMDMAGFCVSTGSACASGSNRGSHVLRALGVSEDAAALRISFGRSNTKAQVEALVSALVNLYPN